VQVATAAAVTHCKKDFRPFWFRDFRVEGPYLRSQSCRAEGLRLRMGNNASAQAAFDRARDQAQTAVEAATGGLTKCMSKDTGQVGRGRCELMRVNASGGVCVCVLYMLASTLRAHSPTVPAGGRLDGGASCDIWASWQAPITLNP